MAKTDPDKILPREERFVVELAKHGDRKAAFESAGYSTGLHWPAYAYRILQRPRVKKRLEELQARMADNVIRTGAMSREAVLSELQDNVKLAKEKGDLPSANRALELIGKSLAMFTERTLTGSVDESLGGKSDHELAELIDSLILERGPAHLRELLAKHEGKDGSQGAGEVASGRPEDGAEEVSPVPEASGVPPSGFVQ